MYIINQQRNRFEKIVSLSYEEDYMETTGLIYVNGYLFGEYRADEAKKKFDKIISAMQEECRIFDLSR